MLKYPNEKHVILDNFIIEQYMDVIWKKVGVVVTAEELYLCCLDSAIYNSEPAEQFHRSHENLCIRVPLGTLLEIEGILIEMYPKVLKQLTDAGLMQIITNPKYISYITTLGHLFVFTYREDNVS